MKYHGETYLKSMTGVLIFHRTHLEHILRATELIEQLHNLGFVHGDIHPKNMVIQPDKSLCIIDFNCSRRVGESLHYMGNPLFASMNVCRGCPLSKRDDIESLIYLAFYLTHNYQLPWSDMFGDANLRKEHSDLHLIKSRSTKEVEEYITEVMPGFLKSYYKSLRKLKADQTPDYAALKFKL
jgi:serine/threonine protein kinase